MSKETALISEYIPSEGRACYCSGAGIMILEDGVLLHLLLGDLGEGGSQLG